MDLLELLFTENGKTLMSTQKGVIKSKEEVIFFDDSNVLTVKFDPKKEKMNISFNLLQSLRP